MDPKILKVLLEIKDRLTWLVVLMGILVILFSIFLFFLANSGVLPGFSLPLHPAR
jgi:hypothetical protein